MALILKPNCEYCDKDLPPNSLEARICSYECTFCAECVDGPLRNVCPNCGGGFVQRPIRPSSAWRSSTSLTHQPPSTERIHLRYDHDNIRAHSERVADIPPHKR